VQIHGKNTITNPCTECTYLGTKIDQLGDNTTEIKHRINQTRKAKNVLNSIWWHKNITKNRKLYIYQTTGCFKKSFTTLKAYRNLYRGHTQGFELSKCSRPPTCSQSLATRYVASPASLLQLQQ